MIEKNSSSELASIEMIIDSDNVFPESIFEILLSEEESIHHDFKLTIEKKNEREWLKITKHFLAFANTYGGYLVFGIKNSTREKIGLSPEAYEFMTDGNNILLKINRNISPDILDIRILPLVIEKKMFSIIFVPANKHTTHVIDNEGAFWNDNNKKIVILRKGEIYVRRAGQSVIATHSDFEKLIERRLKYFRDFIFDNIQKIKYLDSKKEIFVREKDVEGNNNSVYRLSDSSNAIEIKGIPSTTSPKSLEETLAVYIGLYNSESREVPSEILMYDFYSHRNDFIVNDNQIYYMIRFSLIRMTPCFFWLIKCNKSLTLKIMEEIFALNKYWNNIWILKLLWFIDKEKFHQFKKNVKTLVNEFSEAKKYNGFNLFINPFYLEKQASARETTPIFEQDDKELSTKATKIATDLHNGNIHKNEKLWELDCRLYSKYIFNQTEFTKI